MGARETPPPLPDLEANMDPECRHHVIRDCNYMQALEGDIDTVHFAFLHMGHLTLEDTYKGSFCTTRSKSGHRATPSLTRNSGPAMVPIVQPKRTPTTGASPSSSILHPDPTGHAGREPRLPGLGAHG